MLNFLFWVQKIDAYCPQGHHSSKTNKNIKRKVFDRNFSKSQESRPQPFEYFKNFETSNKSQKNYKNNKCDRRSCHNCIPYRLRLLGSILATRVNTPNFST